MRPKTAPAAVVPTGGRGTLPAAMLPVIGLSLDLIGAIALTLGLFRGPVPLSPGWRRG